MLVELYANDSVCIVSVLLGIARNANVLLLGPASLVWGSSELYETFTDVSIGLVELILSSVR